MMKTEIKITKRIYQLKNLIFNMYITEDRIDEVDFLKKKFLYRHSNRSTQNKVQ